MQRTRNYQLPQWETEDRIMMKDFNEMCSNIETAIDGAKSEARTAVEAAKGEAKTAVEAAKSEARTAIEAANSGIAEAKSQAATAKATADAAQQTALTHKNYVSGTYKGKAGGQKITVGFRPSAVIVAVNYSNFSSIAHVGTAVLFAAGAPTKLITFENDGFTLADQQGGNEYPLVNHTAHDFSYIAFR